MSITTREGLLEEWYNKMYLLRCLFAGETPISPIPLPDVTTVDGMLGGIAGETEGAFVALAKASGLYHDYDEAYTLQLPSKLYRWYGVKKIGGNTVLWNEETLVSAGVNNVVSKGKNLVDEDSFFGAVEEAKKGDGFWQLSINKLNAAYPNNNFSKNVDAIHMESPLTLSFDIKRAYSGTNITIYFCLVNPDNTRTQTSKTVSYDNWTHCKISLPSNTNGVKIGFSYSSGATIQIKNLQLEANSIETDYAPYFIDTLAIPAEVQALPGYGMSCPNHVNYIDFEEKKFVQAVGSRDYVAGDESDADVITDGTNTCYPLDEVVETDISEYLTDVDLKVEAGGTITFENVNGYPIPVPSEVEYIGK